MAPPPDTARAAIEAYAAAFTRRDREGWLDLFAPEATLEDPVGSPVISGREALGAFFDQAFELVDDLRLVLDRPITVIGHEAVMVFHAESLLGDTWFRVDIVDHFTVTDDGKIASQRAFFDPSLIAPVGA